MLRNGNIMGDFFAKEICWIADKRHDSDYRKGRSVMARKNIIKILSGVCIVLCTVLFCTVAAHASGITITVQHYTISGSIGVEGVELKGFPTTDNQPVVTDSSGSYSVDVEYGWSGTVKPVKDGYNFSPASKTFTNVTGNQTQDYKATAITYIISGKVGSMADVELNGLPDSPTTGSDGSYSVQVEYGWSGTITPYKEGFQFDPPTKEIQSLKSNMTLNFAPSPIKIKISGNAGTSGAEIIGLPSKIVSGSDGSYSTEVEYNWSGTIKPQKEGYTFQPPDALYQNLTSDQVQDFAAEAEKFVISGTAGMANVKLDGLPGDVYTSNDGSYSATVDYGFSNTVKPVLEGYKFEPGTRTYSKVTANKDGQDYKPTIEKYFIKGKTGVAGVTMNGLPNNPVTTGPDGFYSVEVEYGWNGNVVPEKEGYNFNPPDKTYTVVAKDYSNEDYTASLKEYTIMGNAIVEDVTIRGFPGPAVSTDENGNYTAKVQYGWKGKIIPYKNGYEFDPPNIDFSNVTDDQYNQSFQATTIKYTISGTMISDKGKPVEGITIYLTNTAAGTSGTATTDAQGKYSIEVEYGWTGSIMPNPEQKGYTFQPQSYIYNENQAVKRNITNLNFKAIIEMFKITDILAPDGKPFPGVTVTANPGDIKTVSNSKGEFTIEVPYNWTGEYILSKPGIIFNPPGKSFTNVTSDYYEGNPVAPTQPTPTPPTQIPPTQVPPTQIPPTQVPPTQVPPTQVPPTQVPPTQVPPTQVPPTTVSPEVADLQKQLDALKKLMAETKPTSEQVSASGEVLINENFTGEDLPGVLDTISGLTKIPIIYEESVQGLVSNCNLVNVPLEKALQMILAGTPYVFRKMDSYYLVCELKLDSPQFAKVSETENLQMNYVSASIARAMLALPFQPYVQAEPDPNGRMVTVTAPPILLSQIVNNLKKIDVKPPQVLLDARIVVLEKSDLLNLGVQWGWPQIQSGVFSNDRHGLGDSGLDFAGRSAWGIQIGYSPDATFTNALTQVLNLLQVNNEAKIISKPTVFAQNNKMSRIEVLQEDYYILYATGAAAYYSTTQMQTIITGTVLSITPHIGDNNDIDMEMAIEVSNTIPNPTNPTFPRVMRRRADSYVHVKDGGTVAIAGLSENQNSKSNSKVPLLGDLPVIGHLFKYKDNEGASKEIAVFVTASMVHESNPIDLDFTKRTQPRPEQSSWYNGVPSYPSTGSNAEQYNYNSITPTQPAQPSNPAPAYQNPAPFMGFPGEDNQNYYQPQQPSRAPVRQLSPEEEFNTQLQNNLSGQGQYGSGF